VTVARDAVSRPRLVVSFYRARAVR